jgi:hypothetical protein
MFRAVSNRSRSFELSGHHGPLYFLISELGSPLPSWCLLPLSQSHPGSVEVNFSPFLLPATRCSISLHSVPTPGFLWATPTELWNDLAS